MDVGHNPDAFRRLAQMLQERFSKYQTTGQSVNQSINQSDNQQLSIRPFFLSFDTHSSYIDDGS